jgi:hypothetical protein
MGWTYLSTTSPVLYIVRIGNHQYEDWYDGQIEIEPHPQVKRMKQVKIYNVSCILPHMKSLFLIAHEASSAQGIFYAQSNRSC